jgi:hypothetical protein
MAVPRHGLPGERSGGRLPHPNQRTPQGKVAAANSGHNLPPSPVGPLPCRWAHNRRRLRGGRRFLVQAMRHQRPGELQNASESAVVADWSHAVS